MFTVGGVIRSFQCKDIAIIAHIEKQVHAHPWTEGMFLDAFHAGYSGWVLEEKSIHGNEISAYLIVQNILDECHILTIGVKKEKQRRGYARQLFNFLLDNIVYNKANSRDETQKISKILLEVQESNMPAIKLYQQFGFEQIGIRKHYYQDESAWIFEKKVS